MDALAVADDPDRRLADLAGEQHGVVSLDQLRDMGITRGAVAHRVRRGRLHRLHRGVYAVGHRSLNLNGRWMAAVLACGEGAVLSHWDAAAAWGVVRVGGVLIDVSVPVRGGRERRRGVRLHRVPGLRPDETTLLRGIPITDPNRTLMDLATVMGPERLARTLERAEVLRILNLAALEGLLDRHGSRPGSRTLARTLEALTSPNYTREELERRFLALIDRHGLPRPLVNHPLGPFVADFLWPEAKLIVETDGNEHHGTRAAFERDRARDAQLAADGYLTLRFTYRQVTFDPDTVATTVARVLARRATEGEDGGTTK